MKFETWKVVMTATENMNEPWVKERAQRAMDLFPLDPNLSLGAAVFAMVDEKALGYLEMAPVILVAIIKNDNMTLVKSQRDLLEATEKFFEENLNVVGLMDRFELPLCLCALSAKYLERQHHELLPYFRNADQELLKNSIPDEKYQESWLRDVLREVKELEYRKAVERGFPSSQQTLKQQNSKLNNINEILLSIPGSGWIIKPVEDGLVYEKDES